MERTELDRLLKARPFEPFTVHTVDGDLIGIKSPEFAWLPPKGGHMAISMELSDGYATRIVSLQHISQLTVGPMADNSFPTDGKQI
ncbi:MAG TPA: hypothetical protein VGB55_04595 [Tepidisphaeraceae bacterium]|jgi:hypothetical protein